MRERVRRGEERRGERNYIRVTERSHYKSSSCCAVRGRELLCSEGEGGPGMVCLLVLSNYKDWNPQFFVFIPNTCTHMKNVGCTYCYIGSVPMLKVLPEDGHCLPPEVLHTQMWGGGRHSVCLLQCGVCMCACVRVCVYACTSTLSHLPNIDTLQ